MQMFGPALLTFFGVLVVYSAGFVTYHVSQSDSLEAFQKRTIYLFVWLVPLIGPAITVAALGDDFVRQNRKSRVPLLGYIFLGAALSPAQDQKAETSHASNSESTGGTDGDF